MAHPSEVAPCPIGTQRESCSAQLEVSGAQPWCQFSFYLHGVMAPIAGNLLKFKLWPLIYSSMDSNISFPDPSASYSITSMLTCATHGKFYNILYININIIINTFFM